MGGLRVAFPMRRSPSSSRSAWPWRTSRQPIWSTAVPGKERWVGRGALTASWASRARGAIGLSGRPRISHRALLTARVDSYPLCLRLRSAQRFFIISEILFRAATDIRRRPRGLAPADEAREAFPPWTDARRERSLLAWTMSVDSRSRVSAISRSTPPRAHPMSSPDLTIKASALPVLGRPRGINGSFLVFTRPTPPKLRERSCVNTH